MERFICIHGHFYQPPRENPWLEEVEIDAAAYPYHDWNERINAECYAPNSASRLLDPEGCIINIISNYALISFNFGPTLLSWMERHAVEAYNAILQADRLSIKKRSGHGNAIAQVYNHLIMPLANESDKRTQVKWGIADFEHRFERYPEGMWLAETAVDLATLEVLAEQGLKFCLLAPNQAGRTRSTGAARWRELSHGVIDSSRPYWCPLPSGRRIAIFFYDGAISRAVAFEGLLNRGDDFAARLLAGFRDSGEGKDNQLLTVATDGESYGHHHRFGDMALAYALHQIEAEGLAKLTNYGEYLEKNPPSNEVQIIENTSWSCPHGIERWRADCGCNSGAYPGWRQQWRASLRKALDWLRDEITPLFDAQGRVLLKDPWAARDDYVHVILDRSEERLQAFLDKHCLDMPRDTGTETVLQLMELERHALLMYTSCGWFFDEISGIETVQTLKYAARVIQLAEELFGRELMPRFREMLTEAKSNIPEYHDGSRILDKLVKPAGVDLPRVAAHYALSSLMCEYDEITNLFCYTIKKVDYAAMQSGEARLAVGRVTVTSDIVRETADLWFSALHLGGHIFSGGLGSYTDEDDYRAGKEEMFAAFASGAVADVLRQMDKRFGLNTYSLIHLFRDELHKILNLLSAKMTDDLEHAYRIIYDNHRTLMGFSQEAGVPVPRGFLAAAEFTLTFDLKSSFLAEKIDAAKTKGLLQEMKKWNLPLDPRDLEFTVRRRGEELIAQWRANAADVPLFARFREMVELLREISLEVNYWQIQNTYFDMAKTVYREYKELAGRGDEEAAVWTESFRRLGEMLFFNPAAF